MKYKTDVCSHLHTSVARAVNCWRRSHARRDYPRIRMSTGAQLSLRDQIAVRIAYKMTMPELMQACKESGEELGSARQQELFDDPRAEARQKAKRRAAG